MAIVLTRHAEVRARRRHPDLLTKDVVCMAELARSCGMKGPGNNGCKRYKYMGREFVFDEKKGEPVLVTVI